MTTNRLLLVLGFALAAAGCGNAATSNPSESSSDDLRRRPVKTSSSGSTASSSAASSSGGTSGSSSSSGSTGTTGAASTSTSTSTSSSGTTSGGSGSGGTTGAVTGADSPPVVPAAQSATLAANPTAPASEQGSALSWPAAPQLTPVQVFPNRDSVVVQVPAVAGAADYRVFRMPAGSSLQVDGSGHERINGSTVYCAGLRQHSRPLSAPEVMNQIEVTGLTGPTTLVVEAVDQLCPFPGVMGSAHADINVANSEIEPAALGTFSLYTESQIRQTYGSLIVNGQGPASKPAQPAPASAPRVLARTTIVVSPTGTQRAPLAFFDDFSSGDQPVYVGALPDTGGRSQQGKLFQNRNWSIYSYGGETAQVFVDRGQLHTVLADWSQDIFSSTIAYPRRPVVLSGADYLHVTFEVPNDADARRYWEMFLCGAPTAGATMDASGLLKGRIVESPFFYQADGEDPSVEGWNCLLFFPRDGWPFDLGPSNTRPEGSMTVLQHGANRPLRSSAIDLNPDQYHNANIAPRGWFRQQRADGTLTGPMLDDQQLVSPRTHFDFYVRRDRLVMYVNGQQRLCNDFPTHPLTMAEAALGFGQVLYHSAAERQELQVNYWDRTDQRYYLANTPFVDDRNWDNLGFQEHVPAPPQFDASGCYVAP